MHTEGSLACMAPHPHLRTSTNYIHSSNDTTWHSARRAPPTKPPSQCIHKHADVEPNPTAHTSSSDLAFCSACTAASSAVDTAESSTNAASSVWGQRVGVTGYVQAGGLGTGGIPSPPPALH